MFFVPCVICAEIVFLLALSAHSQGSAFGDLCTIDDDCDSECCGSHLMQCVETRTGRIFDDCFSGSGCECLTRYCNGITCEECLKNLHCTTGCCGVLMRPQGCVDFMNTDIGDQCFTEDGCDCISGICTDGRCAGCPPGVEVCGDPHMQGLRGQTIEWSGVDGGWYCLVTDNSASFHVNVRLTAPLPKEFPDRQLITGVCIMSHGHSIVIEVANPYNVETDGCPREIWPCLVGGGLRAIVDGNEDNSLLRSSRQVHVTDGITVSASNLPVECRQFGGDKIWARMYDEMMQGSRELFEDKSFEDWIMRFDHMVASEWCAKYIAQHNLADLESNYAILKIVTSAVTVRLNVGTNFQGNGELDWDGRILPNVEFWQMDLGFHGLSVESKTLSGILGETARPVMNEDGHEVMKGNEAYRGAVGDYRVSGPLGTDFALQNIE